MQKVFTDVTVITKGGNTYSFLDSISSMNGTSAMRSLNQKTAIDATENDSIKRTFIPYEAIDNAVIEHSLGQEFTPQDANCVVKQDDAEPGTLNITNNSGRNRSFILALKIGQPGTYGGYEFTVDASSELGDGWYEATDDINIAEGETVTVSGLPDGTDFSFSLGDTYTGIIPANVVVSGDGPK